jgi:hypothetical protein
MGLHGLEQGYLYLTYISNIGVEWVVLMPSILEISGSNLKPEASYPDQSSLLIYSFL